MIKNIASAFEELNIQQKEGRVNTTNHNLKNTQYNGIQQSPNKNIPGNIEFCQWKKIIKEHFDVSHSGSGLGEQAMS